MRDHRAIASLCFGFELTKAANATPTAIVDALIDVDAKAKRYSIPTASPSSENPATGTVDYPNGSNSPPTAA